MIVQDLALEFKQIHLDSISSLERWTPTTHEKRLALRLETMENMLAVSQQFKDQELGQKAVRLAAMLEAHYAKQMDALDLHRLAMWVQLLQQTIWKNRQLPSFQPMKGNFLILPKKSYSKLKTNR